MREAVTTAGVLDGTRRRSTIASGSARKVEARIGGLVDTPDLSFGTRTPQESWRDARNGTHLRERWSRRCLR